MRLMLTPTSPYARSVRIALMVKGLDEECSLAWVDPPSDTPELLIANPSSRVPVLELDNGTCLTETLLIMQYLERRAPDPSLLPNSTYLEELALAGRAMSLMDAALWIVLNRRFAGTTSAEGNALETRRINAIRRTLESFAEKPPTKVKRTPALGQILLQVALEYIAFRLPELEPLANPQLRDWSSTLSKMEPFAQTAFS